MDSQHSLKRLYENYKNWISRNPQKTHDYETALRLVSYLLTGKLKHSHIISEFIYSISNLLVLINDQIILRNQNVLAPHPGDDLRFWLSVLQYSEIFLEMSADKLWGKAGKWIIIYIIQLFKFASNLALIYRYKERIITNPAIPALDRRKLKSLQEPLVQEFNSQNNGFRLSSGRVIRRVEASPSLNARNWSSIQWENDQFIEKPLEGRKLVAETIFVTKPILHLISMQLYGENNWKPWILSLFLDITSLQLYKTPNYLRNNSLSLRQKVQLTKRNILLLCYLLKSPFYEKHTKERLFAFLLYLSKTVPLAKLLVKPLMQYLIFYQDKYFFLWSN